uniref:Nudix hydrolase domain-containing protein n=1 Tax=Seriola lalandi dorsalis TaxID=1841481 RepID=A0A3B4Y1J5_SERLL
MVHSVGGGTSQEPETETGSLRTMKARPICSDEVLMVQEAKQDCYKQWYLPAGRVEVGESLEEALRREVKEEAGFDCEPITLLLIQEQGPQWIRFIFLAKVTEYLFHLQPVHKRTRWPSG